MDRLVKREAIAVIPARGGSKRIPQKNIIEFCGKPMLAWTLQAAIDAKAFDRIIVSTDDAQVADVARAFGVDVPFLRDKHQGDNAPVSLATLRAIEQAEQYWGESYRIVVQLMANCPLRGSADIINSINHFRSRELSFQVSCTRFGWLNPWWAIALDSEDAPRQLFPEAFAERSQDLSPLFCPTGAIWIARTNELKSSGSFYGAGVFFHELAWMSAVDIDDYADLEFAEAAFAVRQRRSVQH